MPPSTKNSAKRLATSGALRSKRKRAAEVQTRAAGNGDGEGGRPVEGAPEHSQQKGGGEPERGPASAAGDEQAQQEHAGPGKTAISELFEGGGEGAGLRAVDQLKILGCTEQGDVALTLPESEPQGGQEAQRRRGEAEPSKSSFEEAFIGEGQGQERKSGSPQQASGTDGEDETAQHRGEVEQTGEGPGRTRCRHGTEHSEQPEALSVGIAEDGPGPSQSCPEKRGRTRPGEGVATPSRPSNQERKGARRVRLRSRRRPRLGLRGGADRSHFRRRDRKLFAGRREARGSSRDRRGGPLKQRGCDRRWGVLRQTTIRTSRCRGRAKLRRSERSRSPERSRKESGGWLCSRTRSGEA